jgi:hypothetical protein
MLPVNVAKALFFTQSLRRLLFLSVFILCPRSAKEGGKIAGTVHNADDFSDVLFYTETIEDERLFLPIPSKR